MILVKTFLCSVLTKTVISSIYLKRRRVFPFFYGDTNVVYGGDGNIKKTEPKS
jgi:hypothetical protein